MIYVCDPVVHEGLNSYVSYTVKGKLLSDYIIRRFSNFYALRQKLVERWPGIYIPNIPPKKAVGNLEKEIIQMRTRVLNLFCLKISQFQFIIESEEMKVFLMGEVEASKAIDNLPQLAYGEILLRYKKAFTDYNDEYDIASGKEKINTFFGFVKKALINLKNFKDVVYQTMVKKDQEIENYLTLIHVFEDYEKYTLMEYANNDENKLVFFNPKNIELCEKIMSLKKNLKNPYASLNDWLEDEVLDVEAMTEALSSLALLNETHDKLIAESETLTQRINNLQSNYSKIKLFFTMKTKEAAYDELTKRKESIQESIQSLNEIIKIASFRMERYLEKFKIEKLERYHNHLKAFSELQKDNNINLDDLWQCVSRDRNLAMGVDLNLNNNN